MDGERDPESSSNAGSLLRAVAATPERSPEVPPARIAHFRILGRLGAGGMGVVFRAEDEKLRRPVALKVLPRAVSDDDERRRRFLREARSAAAINHPNVATIYDVGEADGRVFIAMELVEGETLRAKLAAGALPVPEALRIGRAMATGLAKAHEQGIVHRDLKPENVMIARDGAVKILDFGLAKLRMEAVTPSELAHQSTESRVTEEGQILGTPSYMSPEQASGKAVDARSDVFSLGVTLYEMLTGVRPFGATTSAETVAAILRDEPEPPSRRNAKVDAALEAVVLRALRKKPEERFASGEELLAALEGAQSSRRRSRSGLLALVVAVAAVGGALVGWRSKGPAALSASTTTSAAPTPAPAVTRITDLPPPKTSVPAAAAEYAAGIQAMHDWNWVGASVHFAKTIELDPTVPEAYLRASMTMAELGLPSRRVAYFDKAATLRGQLSQRDLALMGAVQPVLQSLDQDYSEADRRLGALVERYPGDIEVWWWRELIHWFNPVALPIADHVLAMDPTDVMSWLYRGDALAVLDRADEAHAAYEQCGLLAMGGLDCFTEMGLEDMESGRCADAERDSRQAADRDGTGRSFLVWAMAGNGATRGAMEETIAQAVHDMPLEYAPSFQAIGFHARLAIVYGDFTRAARLTAQESEQLAANPTLRSEYAYQLQLASQLIDIASETGDASTLRRVAADFTARNGAWQRETFWDHGVDHALAFSRLAWAPDEAPPADFESKRKAWIDSRLKLGAYPGHVWNYGFASPALTPTEARAALDALPAFGSPSPLPAFVVSLSGRRGSPEADLGRVYLLAGRVDDAIPHLRRAVAQCDIYTSTIDHVRAELNLGRALEQKGDRTAACDAYGQVLAQWGHAKPRSVTAEAAGEGVRRLHCGN